MTARATPPPTTPDGRPTTLYRPSPRPQYAGPAAILYAGVTRHVWGDAESGEVFDWIYASTDKLHALVFGLAPGGEFRHSTEFRTVFGADEVLVVVSGTMVIANPQTGEVLRVPTGESAFFRAGTWHHVFAHGTEPLRVLEFMAPPPAAGTTGPYARSREYLEVSRYANDSQLGRLPGPGPDDATLTWLRAENIAYRLEGDALLGLLASTEHLTVASLTLPPGKSGAEHSHEGDEVLYMTSGTMGVRVWSEEQCHVFELSAKDAAYVPAGAIHEYRNYEACEATAVIGVAPRYQAAGEERP